MASTFRFLLFWHHILPFYSDITFYPFTLTSHFTLLLWHHILPFYSNITFYPFTLTSHFTLLFWHHIFILLSFYSDITFYPFILTSHFYPFTLLFWYHTFSLLLRAQWWGSRSDCWHSNFYGRCEWIEFWRNKGNWNMY